MRKGTIITALVTAGAVVTLIAGAFWLGTRTGPPGPAAPAPTSMPSAPAPADPLPDYPITNTDQPGAAITPEQVRAVRVVETYLRLLHERDYTLPSPGYPTSEIPTVSVGDARAAAEKQQAPDRDAYTQAQAEGYRKQVTVIDAYTNTQRHHHHHEHPHHRHQHHQHQHLHPSHPHPLHHQPHQHLRHHHPTPRRRISGKGRGRHATRRRKNPGHACNSSSVRPMQSPPNGRRPGRRSRLRGELTVPLQGHVRPESRDYINQVADACGTSIGIVLDRIFDQIELDPATGRPVWWDKDTDQQEVQHRLVS